MLSPSAKVGLMVILTAAALVGVYFFLTQAGLKAQSYPIYVTFKDANGLERGAPVRMAGVRVGQVESVEITRLKDGRIGSVAKLLINRKYQNQIGRDYAFTIGTVGMLGQPYVEIVPSPKLGERVSPSAELTGKEAVELTDLVPQAQKLLTTLNITATSANKILTDRKLLDSFHATAANLQSASARADQLVASFQGVVGENRAELRVTLQNASEATRNLNRIMVDMGDLLRNPQMRQDLQATLANTRLASERLPVIAKQIEGITGNVESLTGDAKLRSDLKQTLENANQASAQAKVLIDRLNRIACDFKTPEIKLKLGLEKLVEHPRIDLLGGTREGDLRGDVNFIVPRSDGNFWLWGVRNLAESNNFNLQYGQPVFNNLNARYGLWAGHIGLGLDYVPGGRYMLETNIYGLNDPRFDIYNRYRFHENYGAILGLEGIGDDLHLMGGLTYQK